MRRLLRRMRDWFRPKGGPAILMYHRIAKPDVDPWGLSVSPERFADQVEALRAHRTTLSIDDLVDQLQSGDLPQDALALTFDDGYVDNLLRAKPILEANSVSATFFLPTGLIGTREEFWWDELARMVLLHPEPLSTNVMVEGNCVQIDLPAFDPALEPRSGWRAWHPPMTAREKVYQMLWRSLWERAPERRTVAMEQSRRVFGAKPPNPKDLPMDAEEVRRLVSDRVSVGAHGCFHQPLTRLTAAQCLEELQRSRLEAEVLSALPVTGFAYPHGACNAEIVAMTRRAGYRWACSTRETAINPEQTNLYDLPRIAMGDWKGDALLAKLATI